MGPTMGTDGVRGWPRRGAGRPLVLAHRGGTGPWRENTLEAFTGARHAGADGVELDVRLAADGVLVVHHDALVEGAPIHAVASVDLPRWVPALAEVLDACTGWAVNVEIKNSPGEPGSGEARPVAGAVADVLRRDAARSGAPLVVVSSFWPATLEAVRAAAAPVALGLLTHPALDAAGALGTAVELECAAVHLHHSQVDRAVVAEAHGLGMTVAAWTVNGDDEVLAVVDAGVDCVITDHVESTPALVGRLIDEGGPRGRLVEPPGSREQSRS